MIVKRTIHKTRRLILRPLVLSDYKNWVEAWTNHLPKQNKWDYGPKTKKECSKAIFKKYLKRLENFAKKDDCYVYSIIEKKSGLIIGHIDFDIFVRGSHQFANFGYVIYNRYYGKGYGREAAKKGLKIGFTELKLNRLEAAINLDNKKSIKLAKLIGMQREGIKKRYWFEFGKWTDHLIYVANPENVGLKGRVKNNMK